ncbi:alpha/beta hydrolase [Pseudonocardia ailaonensis]|uniref:Alpha/beta hydrolase n=1 Tax=Pseudonocardia ailaonensis TaxID=367279 RepID=A0ABN2N479_9PSEU
MALDDATSQFLSVVAEQGGKPIDRMTPTEARGLGAQLEAMYGPGPQVLNSSDERLPTADGGEFGVRILSVDAPRGVIVYFHGGGWVIGSPDEFDHLGRLLAVRTRCTVVLVDYRLAPEHRYPAAADDSWAALRWVAEQNLADGPLVVAGDSAGGNLAAVVAQRATAEGGPRIDLQVLVYPVTDCDTNTATYVDPDNQLMLSRDAMIWFWDHYVPDPALRTRTNASPLRAEDLTGLPPAVVVTAEHDPLRQEGEAYADRLRAAGVHVESRRFLGQMHGFFSMVNVLPGQQEGLDYVVGEVDRVLSGSAARHQ